MSKPTKVPGKEITIIVPGTKEVIGLVRYAALNDEVVLWKVCLYFFSFTTSIFQATSRDTSMLNTAISPVLECVPKCTPETRSNVSDSLNCEY